MGDTKIGKGASQVLPLKKRVIGTCFSHDERREGGGGTQKVGLPLDTFFHAEGGGTQKVSIPWLKRGGGGSCEKLFLPVINDRYLIEIK